jgi:hypothetical protein
MTYEMKILRDTIKSSEPKKTALLFSACLAADKGVPSEVRTESKDSYLVIADDGQSVRFIKE